MSILQDLARFGLTTTISFTVRNPLESLAATAIISNPTTRGLAIQIGGHLLKQNLRDAQFFSRLIYTNLAAPAARSTISSMKGALTTPLVTIPAAAIGAAAVGATISAGTVTTINRESNISSSSPFSNWSPFGGFGLGTVV